MRKQQSLKKAAANALSAPDQRWVRPRGGTPARIDGSMAPNGECSGVCDRASSVSALRAAGPMRLDEFVESSSVKRDFALAAGQLS